MHALIQSGDALGWDEVPAPTPGPGEIRMRVRAAGVNHADLHQLDGSYPAPPGASRILGLEVAGEVDATGPGVQANVGDRVCALLSGGGYAEYVVCPAEHTLPTPEGMADIEAATLPEALTTAWLNLAIEGALGPGERALVHAGGSGVGTMATQLCALRGNPCFVTVGSPAKLTRSLALGANAGANRHDGRWLDTVKSWSPGGVDVVLDPVGGGYLDDNLRALTVGGRLVLIGILGGRTDTLDLGRLLVRRLRIVGSVLRSRSGAEKAALLRRILGDVWLPLVGTGRLRPVVDRVFDVRCGGDALALLRGGLTFGKLVLRFP